MQGVTDSVTITVIRVKLEQISCKVNTTLFGESHNYIVGSSQIISLLLIQRYKLFMTKVVITQTNVS